jgi:hypothetical protein
MIQPAIAVGCVEKLVSLSGKCVRPLPKPPKVRVCVNTTKNKENPRKQSIKLMLHRLEL